jgi:magnesium-dependent phosphatase 1
MYALYQYFMLYIFDLDFTLWDCGGTWCDHTLPPYQKIHDELIVDSLGAQIKLYPDTLRILKALESKQIPMGVASRTGNPEVARLLMKLFGIDTFFKYQEIYPASKVNHLTAIQEMTGIPFRQMSFFDDEYRNIDEVSSLGVNCYYIDGGINAGYIKQAEDKFEAL